MKVRAKMRNDILRIIQSMLSGWLLSLIGYDYKTVVFWIVVIIECIQFVKEVSYEQSKGRD